MAYPIFISGTGRSGTSMLYKILNLHPQLYAFGETKFIEHQFIREFPARWLATNRHPIHINELKKYIMGPVFKFNIAHPDQKPRNRGLHLLIEEVVMRDHLHILDGIQHCNTIPETYIAIGRYFDAIFSRLANSNRKIFWTEKTPENSVYPDIIHQMFPNMKFLNIIRDGRDVACSVMDIPEWKMTTIESSMQWWASRMMAFLEKSQKLSKDLLLTISYEELVTNFSATIQRVLEFLGVASSNEVESFQIQQTSIARWKKTLTPQQAEFCNSNYGKLLQFLGYKVDE